MRIVLVSMPWAALDLPSLALGILEEALAPLADTTTAVIHGNLDFVDWLDGRMDVDLTTYEYYSRESYFVGCGDWVFAKALDPSLDNETAFREYLKGFGEDERFEQMRALSDAAPAFIDQFVDRVLAESPDVVGFTTTFQQNTASLAAARVLKERAPHVTTVFGGANCDAEQGEAVHRNFPFVDFVVRGEGETAFPQLVQALRSGATPRDIDGLCGRTPGDGAFVRPMSARPLPPGQYVVPRFDGYFARLRGSVARTWVEPKLVVEGARGCWWGARHHCTFCGLNGTFMEFRSKSPSSVFREIHDLVARHQVLDVYLVDNILDMGYFTTLLPQLAEADFDIRLQAEVKSNLRPHHLEALRGAGVVSIQPGVESLSSTVLKLMDKGVTGCQNVALLRDAGTLGISVLWNYLYGFPGETDADYTAVLDQVPGLHHLPPPSGASRIQIERFSPYFADRSLGFPALRPANQYRLNYALPDEELADLAYVFDVDPAGVDETLADRLRRALADWNDAFPHSRLTHWENDRGFHVVSERADFAWSEMRIADPDEVRAYQLLERPHSFAALGQKSGMDERAVERLANEWRELGLVFVDAGHLVRLSCASTNSEVLRINGSFGRDLPADTRRRP